MAHILNDIWNVPKRPKLIESPAIKKCVRRGSLTGTSFNGFNILF